LSSNKERRRRSVAMSFLPKFMKGEKKKKVDAEEVAHQGIAKLQQMQRDAQLRVDASNKEYKAFHAKVKAMSPEEQRRNAKTLLLKKKQYQDAITAVNMCELRIANIRSASTANEMAKVNEVAAQAMGQMAVDAGRVQDVMDKLEDHIADAEEVSDLFKGAVECDDDEAERILQEEFGDLDAELDATPSAAQAVAQLDLDAKVPSAVPAAQQKQNEEDDLLRQLEMLDG